MDTLSSGDPGLDICGVVGAWNHYVYKEIKKDNQSLRP